MEGEEEEEGFFVILRDAVISSRDIWSDKSPRAANENTRVPATTERERVAQSRKKEIKKEDPVASAWLVDVPWTVRAPIARAS